MADRVKISDIIKNNNQAKTVLDIMNKYNIPINKSGNISGDRKIYHRMYDEIYDKLAKELEERKNLKLTEENDDTFDEEKVLKAFKDFDDHVKFLEKEENYKKKQKYNALNAVKDASKEVLANTAYGMSKGVSGSGAGLLGLLTNLGKYGIKKVKNPEDTNFLEEISKENIWLKEQKDFDEMMANVLGVQDAMDSNDKNDKRLQTVGEFIIPQTYLGKPFKATAKLFKDPKKAENVIKYIIPGPQITKGAGVGKNLLEVGTQTPIALGFDELVSKLTHNQGFFGDYTDKPEENITLINDKRSIGKKEYLDEMKDGKYSEYSIPNEMPNTLGWKKYSPFHNDDGTINKFGTISTIGLGGLFASGQIAKKVHQLKKAKILDQVENTPADKLDELAKDSFNDELRGKTSEDIDKALIKKANNKSHNIRKMMTTSEKLDNSLADRLNFVDIMKRNGLLDENVLYDITKDLNTQIDSIWNTGQLTKNIKLRSSPSVFNSKIANLKTLNKNLYDKLEETIERASIIQDETNRANKLLKNVNKDFPELSPDEYISARNRGVITVKKSNQFHNNEKLKEMHKLQIVSLAELKANPITKNILDDLEDYSNKVLDYMLEKGVYSQNTVNSLKKNRNYLGLMSYKPRIEQIDLTWKEKLANLLYHTIENKNRVDNLRKVRTPGVVGEGVNFLETFEKTLKGTILDTESNSRTRDFIKEAVKVQARRTNEILDENTRMNMLLNKNYRYDDDLASRLHANDQKTFSKITDITMAKPLGVEEINTNVLQEPKNYYKNVLNRKQNDSWLDNTVANTFGEREDKLVKGVKDINTADDIIAYVDNDKIYYFQVDPIIKKGFEVSNELPGLIGRTFKKFKDFRQSTITGKLNPLFSLTSGTYTVEENLVALKTIAKELHDKIGLDVSDISKAQLLKKTIEAGKELFAQGEAKKALQAATLELSKLVDGKIDDITIKNLDNFQQKYNNFLISKIQNEGLISSKPYNANSGVYYSLNKETPLSEAARSAIINNNSLQKGKNLIHTIDYIQTALREAPSYAMLKMLGEKSGAIVNDTIVDLPKLEKISDTLGKRLANMGKKGSHLGAVGAVGKFIEDYGLYGHVLFQSLAPKLRNIEAGKAMSAISQDITDLLKPDVTNMEILNNIRQQLSNAKDNTYLQSYVTAGVIPSVLAYIWNYSNDNNRDAYHGISDYDKASRLTFANALGNGRHITIPLEQEVAVVKQISDLVLDTVFGGSKDNLYDPMFDAKQPLMEALNRSLFIDEITGVDLLGTLSGKKININPLDSRFGINDIKKDIINKDLTETAKEEGILSNYALNGLNAVLNTVGRLITGAIEEGNVGAKVSKTQAAKDIAMNTLETLFSPTNLYSSKFTSYNATSQYVYNKMDLISKLGKIKDEMTPRQREIYETILNYKRNRINPIHDMLNEWKRTGKKIDANGILNGERLSRGYLDRKIGVKDTNKGIAELFNKEYHEYEKLNRLLGRYYNTTLEQFMKE